jgi:hypothetical protein
MIGSANGSSNGVSIAAAVLWKLVQADLPTLEKACRSELAAEEGWSSPNKPYL